MRLYHRTRERGNQNGLAIVEERLKAEVFVVGAFMAHQLLGIEHAIAIGLTDRDFIDPDLRQIYHAAKAYYDAGVLTDHPAADRKRILMLAQRAIRAAGDWHRRTPEILAEAAMTFPTYSHDQLDAAIACLRDAAEKLNATDRCLKERDE